MNTLRCSLKFSLIFLLVLVCLLADVKGHSKIVAQDEKRIVLAIREVILKARTGELQIVFDKRLASKVLKDTHSLTIPIHAHEIKHRNELAKHFNVTKELVVKYGEIMSIILVNRENTGIYLEELKNSELSGRYLLHIFLWKNWPLGSEILATQNEAVRIAIFSWFPSSDIFKLFSTHSNPKNPTKLYQINEWNREEGFTHFPIFLNLKEVFKNMKGRNLWVPVLHKPPWYFVKKDGNVSLEVIGGRDHQLLQEISRRLNFRYKYLDPAEKSQGIPTGSGKAGKGVLSLLRKRSVDLFLGDATITYERTLDLDFSFFTMADSVSFITHSPRPLSEAWALVWLAVWVSIAFMGPALHMISKNSSLGNCIWATTSILLKQSIREIGTSHKTRLVTIMLSITATYVIGDLYCANLTSLLAKPGKERPLRTLSELANAVADERFKCFVEERSSGGEFLKNGTREAQKIWRMMRQQSRWMVPSVEKGVAIVRAERGIALIAGRETLLFEMQRFGQRNFHLGDSLSTQYSAIALQQGCPYLENINDILMALFEAGILDRMTAIEYSRIGAKSEIWSREKPESVVIEQPEPEEMQAKPISMKMLQGAFIVLLSGYLLSGCVLCFEVVLHKRRKKKKVKKRRILIAMDTLSRVITWIVK